MMTTDTRKFGWCAAIALTVVLLLACASPSRDTVPCTILQQSARCVTVPVHDDVHEDEAKLLRPAPEGLAYLYITRPYSQKRSVKTKIYLDDVFLAELGPQSFARLRAKPGQHVVKMVTQDVENVSIVVDVNREVFLEYQIAEHFFSTEPEIKKVEREVARKSLQSLDMVVSWGK